MTESEKEMESYDLSFSPELIESVVEEFEQSSIRGSVRAAVIEGLESKQENETEERLMRIIHALLKILVGLIEEDKED